MFTQDFLLQLYTEYPWKKCYDQPREHIKKHKPYFAVKGPSSQSYGFSSSHVWMWELDYKESWAPKNWCFWIVVLQKTLESPLDCKEIQPVHPKRNQPWVFTGRTDAEAETAILWPPDVKNWLIGKDPDAGKDWRREEKGMTEDEMVGWHHWLNGHEFEQALGVGDGQVRHDWATELNWHRISKIKCCQLQFGACPGHWTSASLRTEPCAAAAARGSPGWRGRLSVPQEDWRNRSLDS